MKNSCTETARLLSESLDRRLSLRERISLRIHMMMCRMCHVYARQLSVMLNVCHTASEKAPECCPGVLPEETKNETKARIREAMREAD